MSKNTYVDYKAVKQAVTIVQILEHYNLTGSLTLKGDSYSGPCPIHQGENKTQFRVSVSKNCWNCFGQCQGGGNIIDFVSKMEEVSFRQAAQLIQEWFGLESPRPESSKNSEDRKPTHKSSRKSKNHKKNHKSKDEASAEAEPKENPPLSFALKHLDPKHPYLIERGILEETSVEFGIGYCQKGIMAGRIVIPIHNAIGELVGYAGRWPGEPPEGKSKYKLPKGFLKSAEVFNLHRLGDNEAPTPLVIVEGFFDCMWLWQHGYRNCVALIGSSMSEQQEAAIAKLLEKVETPLVDLLFDEDDAGRKGRDNALCRLANYAYVCKVSLDEEGRQPDDLSPFDLANLIGTALP